MELMETAVANLNGVQVGVANITTRPYVLADGTARSGLTAQLFTIGKEDQEPLLVGEGSVVVFGDATWRVTTVSKLPGQRGTVLLDPA